MSKLRPPERLTTRRLFLKRIRTTDLASFYGHARHEAVAKNAGFPSPRSIDDTRAFVRTAIRDWRKGSPGPFVFSIFTRGSKRWVGGVSLRWPHHGLGELGYSVHPDFWGRGYAPEAARKLAVWALRGGAHRVQATCWSGNRRSAKVLRKIGMKKEGRLRRYFRRGDWVRDEYMWSLVPSDL